MNLVILHYHLNRGGVTQVIANHLRALDHAWEGSSTCRVVVLYGGRRKGWPDQLQSSLSRLELSLVEVEGLDYQRSTQAQPSVLACRLESALKRLGFSPQDTIVHAHNHALGKNPSVPGALQQLASDGWRLLLQIHDFPEDFRAENYRFLVSALSPQSPDRLPLLLYPQGPNIHYATLNRRDWSVLKQAGVAPGRLHLLPNPVLHVGRLPSRAEARRKLQRERGVPSDRPLVLYPVRGIRRKNLGEALLWSALAAGDMTFGLTLAPLNPVEQGSYERWRRRATSSNLPFVFELGSVPGMTFQDNLAAADLLLSTSVAEGFGMVFLEAWLFGRPLIGRDLPEITADYVEVGVRLPAMRSALRVPVDWVGWDAYRCGLAQLYRQTLAGYGQPLPTEAALAREIDRLVVGAAVDFASLTSGQQEQVLSRVCGGLQDVETVYDKNPWLRQAMSPTFQSPQLIADNAAAVAAHFSEEVSGRRLQQLYQALLLDPCAGSAEPLPDGPRILEAFLSLPRFHPIRLEP